MELNLIQHYPLSIKAQIKRQIQAMIEDGRLVEGTPLLSAREMGLFLNINRNTVATAYKELENEGFLNIIKGSGTYAGSPPEKQGYAPLKNIFNQAFDRARQAGFSIDHIVDAFTTALLENALTCQDIKKVILVDCNYEVLETLDKKIQDHCPIESHLVLIQDIQALPGKFKKRAQSHDLILCGMNHLAELNAAVPDLLVQTIGFLIRTDFHIMNQILQLPAGTSVGYCCISKKSAKAFFSSTLFSSGTRLNRIHAGIEDTETILNMLASCDIIFATHYVHDILVETFPGSGKVHKVDLSIDPQNLEYIYSALSKETSRSGQLS